MTTPEIIVVGYDFIISFQGLPFSCLEAGSVFTPASIAPNFGRNVCATTSKKARAGPFRQVRGSCTRNRMTRRSHKHDPPRS